MKFKINSFDTTITYLRKTLKSKSIFKHIIWVSCVILIIIDTYIILQNKLTNHWDNLCINFI